MFKKITIIGCGLIGSSILRNINNNKISELVTVFDKSKDVIETIIISLLAAILIEVAVRILVILKFGTLKEKGFIAISGAELPLYINEIEQKTNVAVKVEKEDQITFGPIKKGFRAYLAFGQKKCKGPFYELPKIIPLKAFLGPEHQLLPPVIKKTLIHQTFKVTKNTNRMGMQLTPRIKSDLPEIITSPVLPGTVQCTPSGRLIVLLADCQVTGGYPRILQLTKESIQKIAQRAPSSEIKFQIIEY